MGTRQTKGSLAERASPGAAPGPRRERPDFWASLLLRAGDKAGRAGSGLPPYHRRVGMVQELLRMVRQGRREEAGTLLQHLRQDLGMESTSLDDVLYRYASFRNLVDPITHDLIISLARYIHCPKPFLSTLIGLPSYCSCLSNEKTEIHWALSASSGNWQKYVPEHPKTMLGVPPIPSSDLLVLKSPELLRRDYTKKSVFPQDLEEEAALLRDLTDTLKDPSKFPNVTWIDLGNNVDIFSLPQPFLLSLRKRSPKQGHLPTILELGEGPGTGEEAREGTGQQDPTGSPVPPARGQESRESVIQT
ncbi:leucine-rich repeat-containing protein 75A [Mus pahari]|uniref:leucine-rich repeat-containing protein 75A n=1 Tax=Mus pahari TaxID=10093 RepID=UPI001114811E|nr:leucine-rich repeat-containing protein 75A [Mus pahari]